VKTLKILIFCRDTVNRASTVLNTSVFTSDIDKTQISCYLTKVGAKTLTISKGGIMVEVKRYNGGLYLGGRLFIVDDDLIAAVRNLTPNWKEIDKKKLGQMIVNATPHSDLFNGITGPDPSLSRAVLSFSKPEGERGKRSHTAILPMFIQPAGPGQNPRLSLNTEKTIKIQANA